MLAVLPDEVLSVVFSAAGVRLCLVLRQACRKYREAAGVARLEAEADSSWSMVNLRSVVGIFVGLTSLDLFDFFGNLDMTVLHGSKALQNLRLPFHRSLGEEDCSIVSACVRLRCLCIWGFENIPELSIVNMLRCLPDLVSIELANLNLCGDLLLQYISKRPGIRDVSLSAPHKFSSASVSKLGQQRRLEVLQI